MTDEKGYNGWKNYETWVVALWVDNDESTYSTRREMAQTAWDEAEPTRVWTREQDARLTLGRRLRDWVTDDLMPDLGPTLAADLLGGALSEVDWDEIATAWLDEVEQDDDEPREEA